MQEILRNSCAVTTGVKGQASATASKTAKSKTSRCGQGRVCKPAASSHRYPLRNGCRKPLRSGLNPACSLGYFKRLLKQQDRIIKQLAQQPDRSKVWRATPPGSTGEHSVYLYGAVHTTDFSRFKLSPVIKKLVDGCDAVGVERTSEMIDELLLKYRQYNEQQLGQLEREEFQAEFRSTNISAHLTPANRKSLKSFCEAHNDLSLLNTGITREQLNIADMTDSWWKHLGLQPCSFENSFIKHWRHEGQAIVPLDCEETALRVMVEDQGPTCGLVHICNELTETLPRMLSKGVAMLMLRKGTGAELSFQGAQKELEGIVSAEIGLGDSQINVERNDIIANNISLWVKNNLGKSLFVLVGVSHLEATCSIPVLLRQRGWGVTDATIEQLESGLHNWS